MRRSSRHRGPPEAPTALASGCPSLASLTLREECLCRAQCRLGGCIRRAPAARSEWLQHGPERAERVSQAWRNAADTGAPEALISVNQEHRWRNWLQSLLLLAGMALLCALLGRLLFGPSGTWWTMFIGLVVVGITPQVPPIWMLRLYQARPIHPEEAPGIWALICEQARRAGLSVVPRLYYVPSVIANAFALGSPARPHIAMTDGLLRTLNTRELAGILAHEISHIRHRDLQVMMLADVISRLTSTMATLGQLMLLINLPLLLLSGYRLPWLPLLLLWAAPSLMTLMQLGLSRAREFDADRGAAELTGDPQGLASALVRIEQTHGGWLKRVFLPGQGLPEPSWLRTHPATEERIARLQELAEQARPRMAIPPEAPMHLCFMHHSPPRRRWWSGLWY